MIQGILFLVYSVSFAQMNLGFYPEGSQVIPTEVKAARAKIYKITMPNYITLTAKEYEPMLVAPTVPQNTKDAIIECQKNSAASCIVPFLAIQGTAFLGKTPNTIWTNCHIVSQWMNTSSQGKTFTKSDDVRAFFASIAMPLQLEAPDGQAVLTENDVATLKAFAAAPNFPNVDGVCNPQDDLVKIQLSRNISSEGLAWANEPADMLFMGGFPHATDNRGPMGKIDSNGKDFFWTTGPSLNKKSPEGLVYLSQKPTADLAVAGPFLEIVLADGVEGMSGSPVLNDKGEVLGIYKGYVFLQKEQKDIPFVSLYVTTSGMRFIEILSGE